MPFIFKRFYCLGFCSFVFSLPLFFIWLWRAKSQKTDSLSFIGCPHKVWSCVWPCSWVEGVDCFSCCRILTLASVLCFLCVTSVRCSTLIIPFSSCPPPSEAWKNCSYCCTGTSFSWDFGAFAGSFLSTEAGRISSRLSTCFPGVCIS